MSAAVGTHLSRPVHAAKRGETMETQAATRVVRNWHCDSRRWDAFEARPGDVMVATFPKCGTTWTQRIVGMLLSGSAEPRPIMREQPWIDARFVPLDLALPALAAVPGRRGVKTHLPFDAVPWRADMFYIHVGRDPRDAAMSWHHHANQLTPFALEQHDRFGLEDETIGRPFPRPPQDPRAFFRRFLRLPDAEPFDDYGFPEYADIVGSWWAERHRPNILQLHYNDLKADLAGEMRRIAEFLEVEVPPALWPDLVTAAGFEAMRGSGEALLPDAPIAWEGGAAGFLHLGTNARWRNVLGEEELHAFEAAMCRLQPGLRAWAEGGRAAVGDPRTAAD